MLRSRHKEQDKKYKIEHKELVIKLETDNTIFRSTVTFS